MKKNTLIVSFALLCLPFLGISQSMKLSIIGKDAKCNGAATGSAFVTPSGGTAPYTYNWAPSGGTANNATGLAAGAYSVTVVDNKGVKVVGTVTITEPAPILVSIDSIVVRPCFLMGSVGGGSCGCSNTLWAIASGGNPPYSYLWTPDSGTADTIHNACYVEFTVKVTDNNKCSVSDSISVTIPNAAQGINELTNASDVKIYPVPANNLLNVSINQLAADTRRLEVYDMMGKMVMQQKLNENTTLINLNITSLTNGNYLLRIVGDNSEHISKFSVAR